MIVDKFADYLEKEKRVSENTIEAYVRDIYHFSDFVAMRKINDLKDVTNTEVVAYLMMLKNENKSKSTLNRKLASIRTFYNYLIKIKAIKDNPALNIKTPKVERKEIEYLSIEDIERLLELPDDSEKGIRDRAILELLYATGIRASELIEMKLSDVNLRMGFIKCSGEHSKARIIPMGRPCRQAVENYVYDVREKMLKGHQNDILFINYIGEKMTRQGLWKILKEYGELLNIDIELTPKAIRNSFAVHMLQNGADLKSLQELMGHEDITATQVYLAVTKNRIKDVYDKAHPRA